MVSIYYSHRSGGPLGCSEFGTGNHQGFSPVSSYKFSVCMARSGFPRVITIISCLAVQKNAAPGRDDVTVLKNSIKKNSYLKHF